MVRQLGAVPPISIHALREEGDRGTAQCTQAGRSISIHALREEGDYIKIIIHNGRSISIHALREEGDCLHLALPRFSLLISIHALREEGDLPFLRQSI